jgi:nucleoside-diphosphate-sugar epimerase
MTNNKKVLVTGGAGFIGSNITIELVKRGYNVKVIDNLSTGNLNNLNSIINNIEFIEDDIYKTNDLEKYFKDINTIFHQAALPSVQRSIDNPLETHNNNSTATIKLLTAAKNTKVKKIIYAASSSAYGNREEDYKVEYMKPQPLSPYAATKLVGEYYMKVFAHVYDIETVCLRYFNVFGPNQDPNSPYSAVIPLFIKAILNDEQPVIYGDGKQSRDFTYVANNVQANILAMESDTKSGETLNVACGKSYSLLDLLNIINKSLGKDIKPIFKEEREGDIKDSLANISKAKKLINYKPIVDFEEGLKKTIEYYKNN